MAKRAFNPIELYVGFVERLSKNTIKLYGNLNSNDKIEKVIGTDKLSGALAAEIQADVTYVASISREIVTNNYNIRRLYTYSPSTKVSFAITNLSMPQEIKPVTTELFEFFNSHKITYNADLITKTFIKASEDGLSVIINDFIPFEYVYDIVHTLKITPSSYFLEMISEQESKETRHIKLNEKQVSSWTKIFVPNLPEEIDAGEYIMSDDLTFVINNILPDIIDRGENIVFAFVGNSGNGKTVGSEAIAKVLSKKYNKEFPFVKVTIPAIMRPTDFFLQSRMKSGDTIDDYTKFYNALVNGNSVILLDEANRVTSDNLNILLGLVDGSRSFFIKGQDHPIAKNNIVIFSYNEGYQYTGTFDMDKALESRMNARIDFELPNRDTLKSIIFKYREDMPIEELNGFIWLLNQLVNGTKTNNITVDASVRSLKNWVFLYSSTKYNRRFLTKVLEIAIVKFAKSVEEKVMISELIKKMIVDFQLK